MENSPLHLLVLPPPEPGAGEIRVRIRACGVCRTDLHVIEGDLPSRKLPIVPGHQVVGVVDQKGRLTSKFKKGDRVGIAWLRSTCGQCEDCRRGNENLCEMSRYTGYDADGGYAEYAVVPEPYAYRIPDRFKEDEAAPLLCAGIIGFRAFKRCDVGPGARLGLFGFGSSAHITIQVARHLECEVYVSTRGAKHRKLASDLGARWVGEADEIPPVKLDAAILFAPVGNLVPPALRSLGKGGRLVSAGIHLTTIPEMTYKEHFFHEKVFTSVESNTRRDGEELLTLAAKIPVRARVEIFPLDEANRALLLLKQGAIEGTAVLVPSSNS